MASNTAAHAGPAPCATAQPVPRGKACVAVLAGGLRKPRMEHSTVRNSVASSCDMHSLLVRLSVVAPRAPSRLVLEASSRGQLVSSNEQRGRLDTEQHRCSSNRGGVLASLGVSCCNHANAMEQAEFMSHFSFALVIYFRRLVITPDGRCMERRILLHDTPANGVSEGQQRGCFVLRDTDEWAGIHGTATWSHAKSGRISIARGLAPCAWTHDGRPASGASYVARTTSTMAVTGPSQLRPRVAASRRRRSAAGSSKGQRTGRKAAVS